MRKIKHADIWKDISVKDLVKEFGNAGFQARRIKRAVDIYKNMLEDKKCKKFLCLAGALIPGGMKKVIIKLIDNNLIDAIITTGGNLTHDLIETFGEEHFHGSSEADDIELEKQKINRIYNVYLPAKAYLTFEKEIQKIFEKLPQKRISTPEFLRQVGKSINNNESFIKKAFIKKIPIFCPSIADSILGFQAWMYSQDHELKVDPTLDQKEILDICFENRAGAVIIGGGVPKHYIAQAMQVSGKGLSYAIQITLDRPEGGGVSGAKLTEAKSWHKVEPDAQIVDITCDATIALPVIISCLL